MEEARSIAESLPIISTSDAISAALRGEDSPAVIYWDTQDPANPGPAYRRTDCEESGALDFVKWGANEPANCTPDVTDGYQLEYYFGTDGAYKGPDDFGVFPVLSR